MKKLPTKIYLRKSELRDHFTQERMVSCDEPFDECQVEYTNLANIWHDASEIPTKESLILYRTSLGRYDVIFQSGNKEGIWKVYVKDYGVAEWAYVNELRPKGGNI